MTTLSATIRPPSLPTTPTQQCGIPSANNALSSTPSRPRNNAAPRRYIVRGRRTVVTLAMSAPVFSSPRAARLYGAVILIGCLAGCASGKYVTSSNRNIEAR